MSTKARSPKPKSAPSPRKPRRPAAPTRRTRQLQAGKFAVEAARLVNDLHCQDILLLDVREKSDITDYILIATGTSDRQIRSVGQSVAELGQKMGLPRYGRDEDSGATWVALDFVDVVVHLFEPASRGHYDLEMLWGDAVKVAWRRKPAVVKKKSPPRKSEVSENETSQK